MPKMSLAPSREDLGALLITTEGLLSQPDHEVLCFAIQAATDKILAAQKAKSKAEEAKRDLAIFRLVRGGLSVADAEARICGTRVNLSSVAEKVSS